MEVGPKAGQCGRSREETISRKTTTWERCSKAKHDEAGSLHWV